MTVCSRRAGGAGACQWDTLRDEAKERFYSFFLFFFLRVTWGVGKEAGENLNKGACFCFFFLNLDGGLGCFIAYARCIFLYSKSL